MQKLTHKFTYSVLTLLCFLVLSLPMGYGQNFDATLFNNGNSAISIDNFPNLACYDFGEAGTVVYTADPNCSGPCLENILDNIPLSSYHVMDIGQTINFAIKVATAPSGSGYDFSNVYVRHVSRVGTTDEETTPLLSTGGLFCLPDPCNETFPGSITPTSGSVNDAIVISVGQAGAGGHVGAYVIPLAVTGPIITEVPDLGSIVTPQIPYLILHDPPGDGSSSKFQSNTTICRSTSTTFEESNGGGFNAEVKVGVAGDLGIIVTQEFEFSVAFSTQFSMTHTNQNTQEEEQCIEVTSEFMTSELSSAIGDGADIFIGYGETLIWGIYDIVEYDGCTISTKNGLTYYSDPNGTTTFVKTANGIEADIAVQLAIANDPNNSTLIRDRAYNQVEVWRDVLAQNAINVANASQVVGNYNFEGGTNSTFSEGITTTQIKSMSYDVAIESSSQITAVAEVGATGFTGGPEFTFTKNEGMSTSSSTNNGQIISYTLTDDEDGDSDSEGLKDIFNVVAYKDPAYGTPIFKLSNGSRTSCPFEGGYRRDQPRLSFLSNACSGEDTKILEIVDDNDFNTPTQIQLRVCNDSNEANDYQLSMTGNNFNALVEAGGGNLTNASSVVYFNEIAAGACQNILVEIEGNGNPTLDQHNLFFKLAPSCGSVPGGASNVEINEADIIQLLISFEPNATYQETAYCDDADMDGITYLEDLCPDVSDTALEFDGVDDQVVIPHDPIFYLLDQDFTMEAWVKPSGATNSETIISKGGLFIFQVLNNKIGLFLLSTTGGEWKVSNTSLKLNEWNHVAVSFDFNTKTATFYLNGVPDGIEEYFPDSASPFNNTGTDPIYIGRQTSCNCNFMNGGIDDIIIWDRALDAMEINETINKPLAGTEAGLVVYYDFNDAPACAMSGVSTLVDKGPNNQDGTLANFVATAACVSDWSPGRNLDSDGNGIGDACGNITCPPDYAGVNSLNGTVAASVTYETSGDIESDQVINTGITVSYNAGTTIVFKPGFEVKAGAVFHAYIDGCTPPAPQIPAITAFEAKPAVSITASTIKVYPNPVAAYSTIAIENEWRGRMQVSLVNMLGQTTTLHSFEKMDDFTQIEFDTSQLPKGYYKVLVSDGAHLATSSFVKL